MLLDKYIIIEGKTGRYDNITLSARMVERTPKLKGNEVGMRLQIEIPRALFTRPTLEARMSIPEQAIPEINITPEVTDNISKIIRESTGLEMSIKVVPFSEEVTEETE